MTNYFWDFETEFSHFNDIWGQRPLSHMNHTAAAWDARADKWEKEITDENNIRKKRSEARVEATGRFLRERGLLSSADNVLDIGCGPGRFAAEFAKTAGSVTGIDISPKMLEYGKAFVLSRGLSNVRFKEVDFGSFDPSSEGWEKAFDLCFASLVPAIDCFDAVEKMERMSKKYCFSSNFVKAEDLLAEKVRKDLFPEKRRLNAWDGRVFYALFNLLWLKGRYPEITYFKEDEEEMLPVNEALATRIIDYISEDLADQKQKILDYLLPMADDNGFIKYVSTRWYGWTLWDVTEDGRRAY